ncbi:hypothetical protein BraRD5C2_11510 [Bradyrhizobium sp. RD5-C2]|nr:hypothetical protein BraRD5C2_11510 [Bradyrhizobium sp. RD5-C2]
MAARTAIANGSRNFSADIVAADGELVCSKKITSSPLDGARSHFEIVVRSAAQRKIDHAASIGNEPRQRSIAVAQKGGSTRVERDQGGVSCRTGVIKSRQTSIGRCDHGVSSGSSLTEGGDEFVGDDGVGRSTGVAK